MTDSPGGINATKCPMCGKSTIHDFRPFCSRRCADIDLGRWLTGSYAVPAVEDADDNEDLDAMLPDGEDTPDTLH